MLNYPSNTNTGVNFGQCEIQTKTVRTFKMVTYFTNSQTWTSPLLTLTTTCGNFYTITGTAPTSPDYMTHIDTSEFTQINVYSTNYESLCPVTTYQISQSNGGAASHSGLNQPDVNRRIYPSVAGQHVRHTYSVRITAEGGTIRWFGPYYIDTGCTANAVYSSSDQSWDSTANTKWVGDDLNIYGWTFTNPSFSMRSGVSVYCAIISNEVKETDGTTPHSRMDSCTSQPCNTVTMKDTTLRETVTWKMKTTITGGVVTHVSSGQVSMFIGCDGHNRYPISLTSWPTTSHAGHGNVATEQATQWVTHGASTPGFTLPGYTSTTGQCPVISWEISNTNGGTSSCCVTGHNMDSTVQTIGGNKVFMPANKNLHQTYTFYIKITARSDNGAGTYAWYGPYVLHVGCLSGQVVFTDHNTLVNTVNRNVCDNPGTYTFVNPTSSRTWCYPLDNTIVQTDGNAWTDTARFSAASGCTQPCLTWSLLTTKIPEVVTWKMKTTWTNNLPHLSATITNTITCRNDFGLSEVSSVTSPQYYTHNDNTVGFILPVYQTHCQTGSFYNQDVNQCLPNAWQTSSSNTAIVTAANLNEPVTLAADPQAKIVRATDSTLHGNYAFFVKVTAQGGAFMYFGPYALRIGCTSLSVSFTNSPSFVTSVTIYVGDSGTGVYTFYQPSASRAWCVITNQVISYSYSSYGTCTDATCIAQQTVGPTTLLDVKSTVYPLTYRHKIKNTYTNNQEHYSGWFYIYIYCRNNYPITEGTAVDPNLKYTDIGAANAFYNLPTYTSSQNTGCPINELRVLTSQSCCSYHSQLTVDYSTITAAKVIPTDVNLHNKYQFYIRARATNGNSQRYAGLYYLDVGCTPTSIGFAQHSSFVTSVSLVVGVSGANFYTMYPPTSLRTYCTNVSNYIRHSSGMQQWGTLSEQQNNYWWQIPSPGTYGCPSQPCTQYSLVYAEYPAVIRFKMQSYFTNSQTWNSPEVTLTIYCGNAYPITATAVTGSDATQYHPHLMSGNQYGYILPTYTSSEQQGCPVNLWEISTTNNGGTNAITAHTGLNNVHYDSSTGFRRINPSNNALHQAYTFYMRIGASGGSVSWFGPFVLHIGCTDQSNSWSTSPGFSTDIKVYVANNIYHKYFFFTPIPTRSWCQLVDIEFVQNDSAGSTWTDAWYLYKSNSGFSYYTNPSTGLQYQYQTMHLKDTILPRIVQFKIKSTHTNSQTLLSPTAQVTVYCNHDYLQTEVTAAVTPQYITHRDMYQQSGFHLPAFTHPGITGCPITEVQVVQASGSTTTPEELNTSILTLNGVRVVRPANWQQHRGYVFYVRIQIANTYNPYGLTEVQWFGPYDLRVGCYSASVSFSDNPAFSSSYTIPIKVGDWPKGVFTFPFPISSRSWCWVEKTEIFTTANALWTVQPKVIANGGVQPHSLFNLWNTNIVEQVQFKIMTHFTNQMTHLSSTITFDLTCNNNYTIFPITNVPSSLKVPHDGLIQSGFILDKYQSSQEWGCPVYSYEVSSSNILLVKPSELQQPAFVGSDRVVYPTDRTKHSNYRFFLKVMATGGSNSFFGPFTLHVGCTQESFTITNSYGFVESVAMKVGDSTSNVYTFFSPMVSLPYCTIATNEIVDQDNNPSSKLLPSSTVCKNVANCTVFDLKTSVLPEYVMFKVKSTYIGGVVHYSPIAAISIAAIFLQTSRDPVLDTVDQSNFAMAPKLELIKQIGQIESNTKMSSSGVNVTAANEFKESIKVIIEGEGISGYINSNLVMSDKIKKALQQYEAANIAISPENGNKEQTVEQSESEFKKVRTAEDAKEDYGGQVITATVACVTVVGAIIVGGKIVAASAAKAAVDGAIVANVMAGSKASGAAATGVGARAAADKMSYGAVANKTVEQSVEMALQKLSISGGKDFDDIFKQEQFDINNKDHNPDQQQLSTESIDVHVEEFKDNRVLVEKLMEPGQRTYLQMYEKVQRFNNPEVKKSLKVRRQEEIQSKIDELNQKDIANRAKKPRVKKGSQPNQKGPSQRTDLNASQHDLPEDRQME